MGDMGFEHAWHGELSWFERAGDIRSVSRKVAVKANFPLPQRMQLMVEGVVRAPFPALAADGLRFTVQHNLPEDPHGDFINFVKYIAQKTKPASGVVVPNSGKYARLAVINGETGERLMFYIKSPEGNPAWLTPAYQLQCFQSVEDASRPPTSSGAAAAPQQQQHHPPYGTAVPRVTPPQQPAPLNSQQNPVQSALDTNNDKSGSGMYPPGFMPPTHPTATFPHPPYGPYSNFYPPADNGQPFPPYPFYGAFPPHMQPPPPGWGPPPDQAPHVVKQEDSGQGSSAGTTEPGRLGGGEQQHSPAVHRTVKVEQNASAAQRPVKSEEPEANTSKASHAVLGLDQTSLGTNAQTHEFVFGAIAELVDNAWDQAATNLDIGVMEELREPILYVRDNGNGMDAPALGHMFRLGHSREAFNRSKLGKYGVGFKTGSMRIGRNAVVFTRKGDTGSIGLLSQDLKPGENNTIAVPMVTFRMPECEVDERVQTRAEAEAAQAAVAEVTPFSVFRQVVELKELGEHGTVVYISKLERKRRAKDVLNSPYELKWTEDDIQLPNKNKLRRPGNYAKSMPVDWSLRSYLMLLYMHTEERKFDISLQGKPVPPGLPKIVRELTKKSKTYTQMFPLHYEADVEGMEPEKEERARLMFAFSQSEADDENCGVCIYWRHRLITSFDTMSMMTPVDFGIVGFLSTGSILNPANNKQKFVDNNENFAAVERWVRECFEKYKLAHFGVEVQKRTAAHTVVRNWAQCEKCGKWRRLPPGEAAPATDVVWYCWRLPGDDPYRDCAVPQEEVDEGEITTETNQHGLVNVASPSAAGGAAPSDKQMQQSSKKQPKPQQDAPGGYKRLRKLGDQ